MAVDYAMTWTKLANEALAMMGRELLTSIDDEGSDAQLVRTMLPSVVAEDCGYYDWSFLRRTLELSKDQVTTGPSTYSYSIPGDCSRITKVDIGSYGDEWQVEGNKLCTVSPICSITYQALPKEPVGFSPAFHSALVHHLIYSLARSLTGNETLVSTEYQLYQASLLQAVKAEGSYLKNTKKASGTSWWIDQEE